MSEVTRILCAIEHGDPQASEQLLPLVYEELRKLAAQRLAKEAPGQTLQATALVHEAYLRLVTPPKSPPSKGGDPPKSPPSKGGDPPKSPPLEGGDKGGVHWNSRGHFFAAAAEAMRRILVEQARRKGRDKHGGALRRVDLDDALSVAEPADDLLNLDDALSRLAAVDAIAAKMVTLRYFSGLTMPEAAAALGMSLRSAERNWTYAKTWLHRELTGIPAAPGHPDKE